MGTDIVVLNGGSSSGKTSIARCLQELLPEPWLTLGVDDLIAAMPSSRPGREPTISFAPDGAVAVGGAFRRVENAWVQGVAAMARAGAGVIVDEVFLEGGTSQARLRAGLSGLEVLWVGVRCDAAVAPPGKLGGRTAYRGWRCRRLRWSTGAPSTTWRWTRLPPRPWPVLRS